MVATTYIFPPNGQVGKAQALSLVASGTATDMFVPSYTQNTLYALSGANVVDLQFTGTPPAYGAVAAIQQGTNTYWPTWQNQAAEINSAGAVSLYTTATQAFFTGAATVSKPYFNSFAGPVYTISGSALVSGVAAFASGSVGLQAYSGNLYALASATDQLAEYNLTTSTASYTNIPITNLIQAKALSASASGVAIVGTAETPLKTYGAYNMALAPDNLLVSFANPNNNMLYLLSGTDPNWSVINSFAASGTAHWCAWNSLSTQVLVTDPADAAINIYNIAGSAYSLAQNLTLAASGTTQVISNPLVSQALVANPNANAVYALAYTSSWAVAQTLSLTNPTSFFAYSANKVGVTVSGGYSVLSYSAGTWSAAAITPLSYTPTSSYIDSYGVVYLAGSQGGQGFLTVVNGASTATASWTGSADTVFAQQGQIIVADNTSGTLRSYSAPTLPSLSLVLENTQAAATPWKFMMSTGASVFGSSATSLHQYYLGAPYKLSPVPYGWAVNYTGAFGTPYYLTTAFSTPGAVTWNPNGNIDFEASNNLYEITTAASLVSTTPITNYQGTVPTAPIGVSSLLWFTDGHLYAATALNSALLQIK